MEKNYNIFCLGCTKEQIEIICDNLPDNRIMVTEIDNVSDIMAIRSFMVIINPTSLTNEELELCVSFYKEDNAGIPVLTAASSCFDTNKIKYRLVSGDNFVRKIKFVIMDYKSSEKKCVDFYNVITDGLMILRAIKENPGISTKKLSEIIERSERTTLRYINSLIYSCENIQYNEKKRGWYLPDGWSVLVDDTAHRHYTKGKIVPLIISEVKCKNYWNWDFWYKESLQLFRKIFSYASGDEPFYFIWYSIAEELKNVVTGRNKSAICYDILDDMMKRLHGNNSSAFEIMRDVLDDEIKYNQLMAKYQFSSTRKMQGFYWEEWRKERSSQEIISLFHDGMTFWCWYSAYTVRFAECWLKKRNMLDAFHKEKANNEFDMEYLYEIADVMNKNKKLSLNELLLLEPIAASCNIEQNDVESLHLYFMEKGMDYETTFKYAHKIGHSMKLDEDSWSLLKTYGISDEEIKKYKRSEYIPTRRATARKMLQIVDLYGGNSDEKE